MVQRRACFQPIQLVGRHSVFCCDLKDSVIEFCHLNFDRSIGDAVENVFQTNGLQDVARCYFRVIRLVGKPQGKDTLFLKSALNKTHT